MANCNFLQRVPEERSVTNVKTRDFSQKQMSEVFNLRQMNVALLSLSAGHGEWKMLWYASDVCNSTDWHLYKSQGYRA